MGLQLIILALLSLNVLQCRINAEETGSERLGLAKFKSSAERINEHGYPSETHEVLDSDGYVLTLFRIPYSHKLDNAQAYRPAILLQHGLLSNSDCWLANGPDHSLAYLLTDAGFDVWLGNARGNIYSRKNREISLSHPHFWRFSWNEIGTSSISAMIDYIIGATGQPQIHYAGHSQGTTVYFVLMSERPEYNSKIKSAHMLAPCAFFAHATARVFDAFDPLLGNPESIWTKLLVDIELLPRNPIVSRVVDSSCSTRAPNMLQSRCENLYLWIMGGGSESSNKTAVQMLTETHPGGASSNQGIHYLQLYRSHKFRRFDWGTRKNRIAYEQDSPPDYDLSKITAHTHLYSAANDDLCAPSDVDTLVSRLTHLTEDYRIADTRFNHFDFISSKHLREQLNDVILQRLAQYETLYNN